MSRASRTLFSSGASTAAILYEQMLGRAARQCPEIGKETFRIFDAVDLYSHLQNLTEMKPVVVNPDISLEQLFQEFTTLKDEAHLKAVRDQIIVKMRRGIKRMHDQARAMYQAETGETPEATLKRLTEHPAATVAALGGSRAITPAIYLLDEGPDVRPDGEPVVSFAEVELTADLVTD
jgi:type I restriction enzyme R subunit